MSSLLFLVREDPDSQIIDTFFELSRDAEDNRYLENNATKTLQAAFRRRRENNKHCINRRCSISVQRVLRGHRGRVSHREALEQRAFLIQTAFYNDQATLIQKIFRGFWCRKFQHNYFVRKAYLKTVTMKGEELRQELRLHEERTLVEQQEATNRAREDEFERIASRLHHLLGTQAIPGIFASPFGTAQPTVFGVAIEDHLKVLGATNTSQSLKKKLGTNNSNSIVTKNNTNNNNGSITTSSLSDKSKVERAGSQSLGRALQARTKSK